MSRITAIDTKKLLYLIFAAALILRLVFVIVNDPIPEPSQVNLDDVDFNYLGMKFAVGEGLTDKYGDPTTTRFPLYPVFLGIIYFIFGWHSWIVFIFQAVIGAFTPIIVYFIAKEFFEHKICIIAAVITAFYPSYIAYSGRLMTENLFLPELALLILFVVRMRKNFTLVNAVLSGAVLGLTCLTRGVVVPMILLFPLYSLLAGGRNQIVNRLKNTVYMMLALGIVMTPWVIRNYLHFHRFMLTSSSGGPVMWMSFSYLPVGNFFELDRAYAYVDSVGRNKAKLEVFHTILVEDNYFGMQGVRKGFKSFFPDREFPESEADLNKMMMDEVKSMIKAHPELLVVKTVKEFLRFWHFLDDRGGYVVSYGVMLPFFFWGLWLLRRKLWELAPLLAFFLYTWGMETAFMSAARYRMPFEIVMIVIGAYGIYRIYVDSKNIAVPVVIGAVVLSGNIYLNYNVSILRNTIRSAATAIGIPVIGTDENYVPHLNENDSTIIEQNKEIPNP